MKKLYNSLWEELERKESKKSESNNERVKNLEKQKIQNFLDRTWVDWLSCQFIAQSRWIPSIKIYSILKDGKKLFELNDIVEISDDDFFDKLIYNLFKLGLVKNSNEIKLIDFSIKTDDEVLRELKTFNCEIIWNELYQSDGYSVDLYNKWENNVVEIKKTSMSWIFEIIFYEIDWWIVKYNIKNWKIDFSSRNRVK